MKEHNRQRERKQHREREKEREHTTRISKRTPWHNTERQREHTTQRERDTERKQYTQYNIEKEHMRENTHNSLTMKPALL